MRTSQRSRLGRASILAAFLLCVPVFLQGAPLDIDGDGTVAPATDGQLILRHLFGFSGPTLVNGAVVPGALRDADAIEDYLAGMGDSLDVDGDGRADALTDGILILRHLLGRTGGNLTVGALSPGATRDAAAIAARIDGIPAPAGQTPARVTLVQANSLATNSIQLDWLPTFDNDTPGSRIRYVLHASEQEGFVPDSRTARAEVIDNATGTIAGLTAATAYYVKVQALDTWGNASWSNELAAVTAAADPDPTSAPRQVLDQASAPEQVAGPDAVAYRLAPGAAPPTAGDILVSTEGDGFLRRAAAVSRSGDQVSVATQPAALNELFDDLEISTEIKLADLPDTSGAQARAVGRGVLFQRSGATVRAVWPRSELTLIEEQSAAPNSRAAQLRASADIVDCTGRTGQRVTRYDGPLSVSFPERVCIEPGSTLGVDVSAAIDPGSTGQYQVTQLLFLGMDHPKIAAVPTNFGATWSAPTSGPDTQGKGMLRWRPGDAHVDAKLRPYVARFVAIAKERDGQCTGPPGLYCQTKTISFDVMVGVTWGDMPAGGTHRISEASAGLRIDATAKVDFQPSIRTESKISGGRLRSGRVLIEGPIAFDTEVRLRANAAGQFSATKRLVDKHFIKIYWAGQVPIVIAGRFKLDARFLATADADLDITQTLNTRLDIKAGLEYRDGGWRLIREAEPSQTYRIRGDSDTHAYVELRFIPDLELAFYDVAGGRLIVEPYLYGESALEGHFLHEYQDDGSDHHEGSDLDYRFTKLEFGGGVDGKARAGLEAFDRSIVGYPSRDTNQLVEFTILGRTAILGLPSLTPALTSAPNPDDCYAVGLTAQVANVPNPFKSLVGGAESFNPFEDDSAAWQVIAPSGTGRLVKGTGPRDLWFSAGQSGQYTLRFSGHSSMGSFVRQYQDIRIDYDAAPVRCAYEFATGILNDTGQTTCFSDSGPVASEPSTHPWQDCTVGRDAAAALGALPKVGAGSKGFDFTKISYDGRELPATASLGTGPGDWACTHDNVTGLTWLVNGVPPLLAKFAWYNDDADDNGGYPGAARTICERCGTSYFLCGCTTQNLVALLNRPVVNLCGWRDWRLPTRSELLGLVDYYHYPPVDSTYIPGPQYSYSKYWSGSASSQDPETAWMVDLFTGRATQEHKSMRYHVLLVRGRR